MLESADDFTADTGCGFTCDQGGRNYGGNGPDMIYTFQVSVSGMWMISICPAPEDPQTFDNSMQLREGGVCPGDVCLIQSDDNCTGCGNTFYGIIEAELTAGSVYYLIVDGFDPNEFGPFTLVWLAPVQNCRRDEDCDDGLFCNGPERCKSRECVDGAVPCIDQAHCDEDADVCLECLDDAECDDSNDCTTDDCIDNACVNTSVADDTPCPDGLFCNGDETCQAGVCTDQADPCIDDAHCDEDADFCSKCSK